MVFEDFAKFRGMLLYNMPIIPALYSKFACYVTLCSMLWHAYYASNYAGIIGAGLILGASTVSVSIQTDLQLSVFSSKNDVAIQTEDSAIQYKGKEVSMQTEILETSLEIEEIECDSETDDSSLCRK